MNEKIPSKAEIVDIVQGQAQSLDNFSERFVKIEQLVDRQESKNTTVVYAVLLAVFLIVATVAVQVSISDKRDRERTDNLLNKAHDVEISNIELKGQIKSFETENTDLQNQIKLIRERNPYLK